jgi:hypothetical protein
MPGWLALVAVCVFVTVVAGCRSIAASNGLLEIANLDGEVSVHWESPGLLGTPVGAGAGTEPIRACETYVRGFTPGDHAITITTSSDRMAFVLTAPTDGQYSATYVVAPDGLISEADEAADEVVAAECSQ